MVPKELGKPRFNDQFDPFLAIRPGKSTFPDNLVHHGPSLRKTRALKLQSHSSRQLIADGTGQSGKLTNQSSVVSATWSPQEGKKEELEKLIQMNKNKNANKEENIKKKKQTCDRRQQTENRRHETGGRRQNAEGRE